jgi:hypothetical protein
LWLYSGFYRYTSLKLLPAMLLHAVPYVGKRHLFETSVIKSHFCYPAVKKLIQVIRSVKALCWVGLGLHKCFFLGYEWPEAYKHTCLVLDRYRLYSVQRNLDVGHQWRNKSCFTEIILIRTTSLIWTRSKSPSVARSFYQQQVWRAEQHYLPTTCEMLGDILKGVIDKDLCPLTLNLIQLTDNSSMF